MQSATTLWGSIFDAPHKTEYRFDIDGVSYEGGSIKGTPVIVKPMLDKPAIGRVCTGSLKFSIRPKSGDIPKAATVNAFCRLLSADGKKVSEWIPQGKYFITSRTGKDVLTLNCLDYMIKAGATYRDKSAFTEWPVSMRSVVNEICSIMGVSLDPRTNINAGSSFMVDYPNDDTLISEVLGMIAVAHGGNWIMTEGGKLRLIVFSAPGVAAQTLGRTHSGFTARGKKQYVSRVILTDSAENDYTAGDDTGFTISAKCDYATQEMANLLCVPGAFPLSNGIAYFNGASLKKGSLTVTGVTAKAGSVTMYSNSVLYGVSYEPYTLDGAYLNPAIELGDTLSVTDRYGAIHNVVVQSVTMNCTVACTCSLSARIDDETEDEYPYISMQDLTISRTLKTNQTYFGNRITRSEGFVSELLVNDAAKARLTANAAVFSMQSTDEKGNWIDRIYFDTQSGKYVITADVTIKGVVTMEDLSTAGKTVITGNNITTGILKSKDGKVQLNLDTGTFTVKGTDVAEALDIVENSVTLLATSQLFTKTGSATAYTPTSITLTAQTSGNIVSYAWYKDSVVISGATSSTYTVKPADIAQGKASTYKVVCSDAAGNTYTDYLSIAKLSDGKDGTPGQPGKDGVPGVDGYTITLSNEYLEIPVGTDRKPTKAVSKDCVVSVYKGVTPLTATLNSTLSDGQFKVAATNTVTGITVTQTTAGTLILSAATSTAIADSATLELTITVYGGLTLTANIVIQANMNAVTVKQQSSIEANERGIALKVSKDSIISEINQSAEEITISASKVNLSGYVTITGLSSGTTVIDGACIQTGSISADRISGGTIDASQIAVTNLSASSITSGTLSASRISGGTLDASKITVSNLSASSITTGTLSASRISGGTLDASKITVSNLSASSITSGTLNASYVTISNIDASNITAGTLSASRISGGTLDASKITVSNLSASSITSGTLDASKITVSNLNASNIKSGTMSASFLSGGEIDASKITVKNLDASKITTGTISADRIDASKFHVQNIYAGTSNKISLKSNGTSFLYVGGDGSWNVSYMYIYASSYIYFKTYGYSSGGLQIDMSSTNTVLRPSFSQYGSLGSSSYYFLGTYTKNLYANASGGTIVLGASNSYLGFFGHTAVQRKSQSTSSATTIGGVNTVLNNLINALKGYGLLS